MTTASELFTEITALTNKTYSAYVTEIAKTCLDDHKKDNNRVSAFFSEKLLKSFGIDVNEHSMAKIVHMLRAVGFKAREQKCEHCRNLLVTW